MNHFIKTIFASFILIIPLSSHASEFGLLLGLRSGNHYDASADIMSEQTVFAEKTFSSDYRTFWIRTTDDGQMELVMEKTSLLIPRNDGFWRVDVRNSVYNDFAEDFIWINAAPDPDDIPNPFLAEQEGIKAFDVSYLVKKDSITPEEGEYCTGYTARDILFVGTTHLSVGYTHNRICSDFFMEANKTSALQMLSLEQLEATDMVSLLNSKDRNQFTAKSKEFKNKNTNIKEWGKLSGGIIRGHGKWEVKGQFPISANEKYAHFDTTIEVPKSLNYSHKLSPSFGVIKKQIPDAVDAMSSVDGKWLVVLTDTGHLFGFAVENGKIAQKAALHILFKKSVNLVMAYWAEGQYINNWADEIQNLGPEPQNSWFVKIDPASTVATLAKTTGVVVTQTDKLNIRANIGQYSKPIARVDKGTKVEILDTFGQWYQIQLDTGIIGYAQNEYIKILPKLPYMQPACPLSNCNHGTYSLEQEAILYSEPFFAADSLTTLKANQTVQVIAGKVHTSQFGEIIVTSAIEITDNGQKLVLQPGDKLFDLEPVALGMHLIWYNGDIYYLENGWNAAKVSKNNTLWGKMVAERKTVQWIQVNIPESNLTGWVANAVITDN
ncbi:MAG: SH3 domain-containing protein [Thiomargarita sp.]|nr:SH3 domain-containing protein [Thiomargarita sp.]